jgi:glutamine synthetase
MDTKEILQYVKNHAAGKVKLAITDIDGVLRGKYISSEKFFSLTDSGTSFCDVIFGWDAPIWLMIIHPIPGGIPDILTQLLD